MKPLLCAFNVPLNPSSNSHDHYDRSWTLRITADLMKMIMAVSTQKSVIHNKGPKNSFPLILLLQENTMSIKQAGWGRGYTAYMFTFLFFTKESQDRKSSRTGIWSQELMRGHGKLRLTELFSLYPCRIQDYQPWIAPLTMNWALPH